MQEFQNLLLEVYVSLNMFWAPPRPSSGDTTALTASGFTLERGGSSAVGRGLASGQTTTNSTATTTLQGKTRGC
jgi:hypothetical protein